MILESGGLPPTGLDYSEWLTRKPLRWKSLEVLVPGLRNHRLKRLDDFVNIHRLGLDADDIPTTVFQIPAARLFDNVLVVHVRTGYLETEVYIPSSWNYAHEVRYLPILQKSQILFAEFELV